MNGHWALRYLLDRGVLSSADAVLTSATAEETSISHSSFYVRVDGRPQWFVKRADPVRSQGRDLGAEAAVYRLAAFHPALAQVIPRCRLIDEGDNIVVLDAINGKPLTGGFQWSDGRARAGSIKILRAYGDAVAHVHSVRPAALGKPPWLLVALEPRWGDYSWLPRGCASLLARLAASVTFQAAFRQARFEWQPIGLVHGDLRWANALLDEQSDSVKIWLVDWELACLGDPAWDIASMLADVVATAALAQGNAPPADDPMALSISMLEGYRAAARLALASWVPLLQRSVRLAGVRMVQTMIEQGHVSDEELSRAEAALIPWSVRFLTHAPAIGFWLANAVGDTSAS